MLTDLLCIKILIVYDMVFAVIIGKVVYDFMCKKLEHINTSSVIFVVKVLPEKRKEVRSMVYTLGGSSICIFLGMIVFVLGPHYMFLFYGLCALTFVCIIYLMLFIHQMKKYEQLAIKQLLVQRAQEVRAR